VTPDTLFDEFPSDMFDHIEPLPSPSEWWRIDHKAVFMWV
jgi:hypothetical protein